MSPKQCRVFASTATTVKMKQVKQKGGSQIEENRCGEEEEAQQREGVCKDKA